MPGYLFPRMFFFPHPPDPRSQSALPTPGKGEAFVLFCRGLRPRHPYARAGSGTAYRRHSGSGKRAGQSGNEGGRKFPTTNTEFRKVLGGLGASFKKPPTLPPLFLSSYTPKAVRYSAILRWVSGRSEPESMK